MSRGDGEEVFSLDIRVQRHDLHVVPRTEVPRLLPAEVSPALSPGQQVAPAFKVVVAASWRGDGNNPELTERGWQH